MSLRHPRSWRALLVAAVVVPATLGATTVVASAGTTKVVGTVVRAYVDHRQLTDPGAAHDVGSPVTWVQPRTGAAVRVPTSELPDAAVGATVAVVLGGTVRDPATTDDGMRAASAVLSATVIAPPPAAATSGVPTGIATTDTVEVAMVLPGPAAVADATTYSEVTGLVTDVVAPFWTAQTGGRVQLSVVPDADQGWFRTTADCTDADALWAEVATHVGFTRTPGNGAHLVLYVPPGTGCSDGLGTVGAGLHDGGVSYVHKGTGSPGDAYWHDELASVITHEIGHNLGLEHSGSQECQATTETGNCVFDAYGDYYDVMGASWDHAGTLSAPQEKALGLLPDAQVADVTESTGDASYQLSPISGSTGTRALRLTTGAGDAYYVEFRPATGQDSFLGTTSRIGLTLPGGVQLRRAEPAGSPVGSALLDGTPSLSADYDSDRAQQNHDPVLRVGAPVPVDAGTFTVTVQSIGVSSATVRVTAGLRDTMLPGTIAWEGQQLASPDGHHTLDVQSDGNLVEHAADGRVIWNSGSHGAGADLEMQGDGNLVAYDQDGNAIWNAGTWGNPGARLRVQDDGNLVVYRADGSAAWWTGWDTPDRLRAGQFLLAGQQSVSPDGRFHLQQQNDGNLVLSTVDGRALWHAGTYGNPGARTVLQPDGNLVVYSTAGRALWYSGTWGNPGAFLVVQPDGNLVVYSATGRALWWSGQYTLDTLRSGAVLAGGQALVAPRGRYEAVQQSDGNLVVYADHRSRVLWNSGTWGQWLARATMQADGNLVIRSMPGTPLWDAHTWANPGSRLVVQDDGNLVVYSAGGRALWWSGQDRTP